MKTHFFQKHHIFYIQHATQTTQYQDIIQNDQKQIAFFYNNAIENWTWIFQIISIQIIELNMEF